MREGGLSGHVTLQTLWMGGTRGQSLWAAQGNNGGLGTHCRRWFPPGTHWQQQGEAEQCDSTPPAPGRVTWSGGSITTLTGSGKWSDTATSWGEQSHIALLPSAAADECGGARPLLREPGSPLLVPRVTSLWGGG